MNEITKTKVNKMTDCMQDTIVNLYTRWLDEQFYEDFQSYINFMQKKFEEFKLQEYMKNAFFVKGSKRPFGFTFDFEGWRVTISTTTTRYGWKAKRYGLEY